MPYLVSYRTTLRYVKSLVELKEEVMLREGPDMKEALREPRHLWITNRIAETKEIPEDLTDFYKEMYPPIPDPVAEGDDGGGKGKKDKGKKEKGGKKKGGKKKGGKEPAPPEEPPALQGYSAVTSSMYGQTKKVGRT